jgi:hypothetical protein
MALILLSAREAGESGLRGVLTATDRESIM